MRARVMVAALAAVVSFGGGCSSSGGGGTSTAARPGGSRQQDVISESEITSRATDASNALQIVQKLRPQMLRSRGLVSPNDMTGEASMPKVYVDNVSYGSIESLANINAAQVKEIKFIKGPDATTTWGTGHMGGVILVTTKK
jgi:hypothetical protein